MPLFVPAVIFFLGIVQCEKGQTAGAVKSKSYYRPQMCSVAVRNPPHTVPHIIKRLFTQPNGLFSRFRELKHSSRAIITNATVCAAFTLRYPWPAAGFPAHFIPCCPEPQSKYVGPDHIQPGTRRHRSFPINHKGGSPTSTLESAFSCLMA